MAFRSGSRGSEKVEVAFETEDAAVSFDSMSSARAAFCRFSGHGMIGDVWNWQVRIGRAKESVRKCVGGTTLKVLRRRDELEKPEFPERNRVFLDVFLIIGKLRKLGMRLWALKMDVNSLA
jgi:hypothetical protein